MTIDLHEEITNKIIEKMETGVLPWRKPWKGSASFDMPLNATTQHSYSGINIPLLWLSAEENGFETQEWGSYNQWAEKKEQVKRGSKGSMVIFYKTLEKEKDGNIEKIPLIKYSNVFNRCQLQNYKPTEKPDTPLIERLEHVDQYIQNTGANIYHDGGNRAYYSRATDDIHLPVPEAFIDTESMYAVTLHELVHYTAKEDRCNRTLGKRFGDDDYAFEELVAELGSAFECAGLGITNEPRDDHVSYIGSWLKKLKENKKYIFAGASEASKAVGYLDKLQVPVLQ